MFTKVSKALFVSAIAIVITWAAAVGQGTTSNPTRLQVKLVKTELSGDNGWVEVFNAGASARLVDLIADPGSVFGTGSVPGGRFDRLRLTLVNELIYSGQDGACSASNAPLLINNQLAENAEVTLTFATAAQGGGTSWYNNGTDAHPFLLVGAIDVSAGATTRVTLTFNTAGTLVCEGSVFSLEPPSVNVSSYVVPTTQSFVGGDYWIIQFEPEDNTAFLTRNPDGTLIPPATQTQWAQVRQYSRYRLGLGKRVQFASPDAQGLGTIRGILGGTTARFGVDQTACGTSCGVWQEPDGDSGVPAIYALSADRKLKIYFPNGDGVVWAALSPSYEVLVGVILEGENKGTILGIKTATKAQTMAGTYAWNGFEIGLDFPIVDNQPGQFASDIHFVGKFGWLDLNTGIPSVEFDAIARIQGPASTSAFASTYTRNHISSDFVSTGFQIPEHGGYGGGDDKEGAFLALSPNGNVALFSHYANFRSQQESGHRALDYSLILKHRPAGTYTNASVVGDYVLAGGGWDWVFFQSGEVTQCLAVDPVPGSLACGGQVMQYSGLMYAAMHFFADGRGTIEMTTVDFLGITKSQTDAGNFAVEARCFGVVQGVRLAFDDTVCNGGKRMDMLVLRSAADNASMAEFFIGDDGNVLTFYDPKSIAPQVDLAGHNRSLGFAVRVGG